MTINLKPIRTITLIGTCVLLASSFAFGNMIDTLTGLNPGDLIGGEYTFQNGDPSIPMAADTVAADGTVSFLKPSANFDNIEYRNITTGKPILALINPPNEPVNNALSPGMEFPYGAPSFFDVFFTIDLEPFLINGLSDPGTFPLGQELHFENGNNLDGFPSISIPGYTGSVFVQGYDVVSPEPSTLVLLGTGLLGLLLHERRRRQAGAKTESCG